MKDARAWGRGMLVEAVGWVSSFILVLTIARQVYKQWQEGTSEGVSKWLFVGQISASLGFTAYSLLVRNWVFVVTNSLMLLNGLLGLAIVFHHRRRKRRAPPGEGRAKGLEKQRLEVRG